MKKKINNYRFQQQQQARKEYQKVKKIKAELQKQPEDATEELEYMKKLLNGEDVSDFGPEEPVFVETNEHLYWASHPMLSYGSSVSKMSLSELLSIGTIKQRKRI